MTFFWKILKAAKTKHGLQCASLLVFLASASAANAVRGKVVLPEPARAALAAKHLALKDAVLLALRQNPDVLNTELDMVTYRFALETAQNAFLPQFSLSGSLNTNNFLRITPGVATGVDLKTPLGTDLKVGYTDDLAGTRGSDITITQPLLRGFGLSLNQIGLQAARDGLITQHLTYRDAIIGVVVKVVNGYRGLMKAYQDVQDNQQTMTGNQKNFEVAKIKYRTGRFSRNDMLQAKQAYVSSQYEQTKRKQQVFVQYQDLLRLIGLDPDSKLTIDKTFKALRVKVPAYRQALVLALLHNTAYISSQLSLNAARRGIITARDGLKWQLGLTNTTTLSLTNATGSRNDTTNQTGLALTVPIRDISSRQGMVSAKIALAKAYRSLAQEKLELEKTITSQLQTIRYDKDAIRQAGQALGLQQRTYKVAQLQWQYGKISTIDLLQQQTTLTQNQSNSVSAQLTYANDVTALFQTLGLTLDQWHIKLRY